MLHFSVREVERLVLENSVDLFFFMITVQTHTDSVAFYRLFKYF